MTRVALPRRSGTLRRPARPVHLPRRVAGERVPGMLRASPYPPERRAPGKHTPGRALTRRGSRKRWTNRGRRRCHRHGGCDRNDGPGGDLDARRSGSARVGCGHTVGPVLLSTPTIRAGGDPGLRDQLQQAGMSVRRPIPLWPAGRSARVAPVPISGRSLADPGAGGRQGFLYLVPRELAHAVSGGPYRCTRGAMGTWSASAMSKRCAMRSKACGRSLSDSSLRLSTGYRLECNSDLGRRHDPLQHRDAHQRFNRHRSRRVGWRVPRPVGERGGVDPSAESRWCPGRASATTAASPQSSPQPQPTRRPSLARGTVTSTGTVARTG
jgi:hypothetical protein